MVILDNLYYASKYFKEGVGLITPSDFNISQSDLHTNTFVQFLFEPNLSLSTDDICYTLEVVNNYNEDNLKFRLQNSNQKLYRFGCENATDKLNLEETTKHLLEWFSDKQNISNNTIPFYIRLSICVYYIIQDSDVSLLDNLHISNAMTNVFENFISNIQISRIIHYTANNIANKHLL